MTSPPAASPPGRPTRKLIAAAVGAVLAGVAYAYQMVSMNAVFDGGGVGLDRSGPPWPLLWFVGWLASVLAVVASPGHRKLAAAVGFLAWLASFALTLASGLPQRALVRSIEAQCEAGSMMACGSLAERLRAGFRVPRDVERADALDQRACQGGWAASCLTLIEKNGDRAKLAACPGLKKACAGPSPGERCTRALALCDAP